MLVTTLGPIRVEASLNVDVEFGPVTFVVNFDDVAPQDRIKVYKAILAAVAPQDGQPAVWSRMIPFSDTSVSGMERLRCTIRPARATGPALRRALVSILTAQMCKHNLPAVVVAQA